MSELLYSTRDSAGYTPDTSLLGTKWIHTGNWHTYTITGFKWHGDDDRWHVCYSRPGCEVQFSRTPENMFSLRGSKPRFERAQ